MPCRPPQCQGQENVTQMPTFRGHLDRAWHPQGLLCPRTSLRGSVTVSGPDQRQGLDTELLKPTPRTEHTCLPPAPHRSQHDPRRKPSSLTALWIACAGSLGRGAAPPSQAWGLGLLPGPSSAQDILEARGLAGRTALVSPHLSLMGSLISCRRGSAALSPRCHKPCLFLIDFHSGFVAFVPGQSCRSLPQWEESPWAEAGRAGMVCFWATAGGLNPLYDHSLV